MARDWVLSVRFIETRRRLENEGKIPNEKINSSKRKVKKILLIFMDWLGDIPKKPATKQNAKC